MSGSLMRQSLLTNDLANANTPGFQAEDVNFQQTLQQAMAAGQSPSSVSFTPFTTSEATGLNGNGVDSDETNAELADNGLLYQDLTQVAAAREGILETAMNASANA